MLFTTRKEEELPFCVQAWGWQFHHIGIPTAQRFPEERHIPHLDLFATGFPSSPFGVEYLRFGERNSMPELVKTVPHVAFAVADIDEALEQSLALPGVSLLIEKNSPCEGIWVAMIAHNMAPIELISFVTDRSS